MEGYIIFIPVSISSTSTGTLGLPAPSARLRPLPPELLLLPIAAADILAFACSECLEPNRVRKKSKKSTFFYFFSYSC
jgi:hypothetical protein